MLSTLLTILSLALAGAACALALVLYRKLSAAHKRIHRLELVGLKREQQLTSLSRFAAEARARQAWPELPQCHAQHGEEFFLWERLGFKPSGVFIEIGAYDGTSLSNSLFFEQLGWKGLLVEAHPALVEKCRADRPNAKVVHAALGAVDGGFLGFSMVQGDQGLDTLSFVTTTDRHRDRIAAKRGSIELVQVPARTLRGVLQESGLTEVDWMSIDVEGAELDVLKGADLAQFKPKLILVEDNSAGQDPAVPNYLAGFGYRLDTTIGCNDLYVREGSPTQ